VTSPEFQVFLQYIPGPSLGMSIYHILTILKAVRAINSRFCQISEQFPLG